MFILSPPRRFQSLLYDCHQNLLNYIFIVDSRCQKLILRPRLFWLNTAFALNNHTIELVSGYNSHEEGSNVQYMFEMEHAFTIASNKTFPFRGKIHNSWAVYLFIINHHPTLTQDFLAFLPFNNDPRKKGLVYHFS